MGVDRLNQPVAVVKRIRHLGNKAQEKSMLYSNYKYDHYTIVCCFTRDLFAREGKVLKAWSFFFKQ